MKKTFKIVSLCVAIIGALSAVTLGCVYFESISQYISDKLTLRKQKEN